MKMTRKLHIGGKTKSDGWEVLDANPAPFVDHVCNANDLSQFADNTFMQIYSSHVIEHLDYIGELQVTLKEWNRVLMPGGQMFVSVPDLDVLAELILDKKRLTADERFFVMRMMFGGHVDKYDYHVTGLNEEFLSGFLNTSGYVNIRKVKGFGLFDDTSSMLFKGVPISLNMIAEKGHDISSVRHERSQSVRTSALHVARNTMFNWFKKTVLPMKAAPELEVAEDSITESAIEKSVALKNQGNVHLNNNKLEDAAECYRQAIACNPYYAEAYSNLGLVLEAQGNLDKAVTFYRKAIEFSPRLLPAHQNLGFALLNLGQGDAAEESLRRVIELDPEHAAALQSLGVIAAQRGEFPQAETLLRRALELQPDYAEAHSNLGNVLKRLGKFEDAVASYRWALQIKPDLAEAHSNLGDALYSIGQLGDAVESCRLALKIKPDFAMAHNHMGLALKDIGQLDEAIASYRRALQIKPDFTDGYSNLLLTLNYTADHAPSHYLEQARQFGRVAAEKATCFSAWQCVMQPERLRVGLVSGDFRKHSVGFFLEGLLARIDSTRIELIAYTTNPWEDEITVRIRPYFSAWKSLFGKSDEEAARLIHADGVHVLFDLSGHTGHSRLPVFAWKPAPVQVSWLGYFASTGVAEIDYLLADKVGIPEDQREKFTESIWYLSDTRLCFTAPEVDLSVAPLPALSKGAITFGCFQNLTKVNEEVLAVWGDIFAAMPNARLRMQCKQLGMPSLAEQMLQRLQRHGIEPVRVELYGAVSRKDYLAAHAEVDIILDTFPFPGGTTSCEALWMGVPTLTLAGDGLLARQGASLLTAAGLDEWVAEDKWDYIARAIALSGNLPKLAALRAGLRQRVLTSPLFDAPRFARNFESALDGMWQNWCEQHDVLGAED